MTMVRRCCLPAHLSGLSDPMGPGLGLVLHGGVPIGVVEDDRVGGLHAWRGVVWCGVVWRGVAWRGVESVLDTEGSLSMLAIEAEDM